MNAKLKKIVDRITNRDVIPGDIPDFYYLKKEDLKYGQVDIREDDDEFIQEVFEYNARAAKARIIYKDVEVAKKGYFKVNLVFILVAVVLMEIYKLMGLDNFSVRYGTQAICVFSFVYMYSRFMKKFNIYLNVSSTFVLIIVHKVFIVAIVANILLCYLYYRPRKKIKDEFGYPNFPAVDMILYFKNRETKKIFASEME